VARTFEGLILAARGEAQDLAAGSSGPDVAAAAPRG
jgi:hypothetical protein